MSTTLTVPASQNPHHSAPILAPSHHYILIMRDEHYFLVGPFCSNDDAGNWGRDNNPSDDPRWQTIRLADAGARPPVYAPDTIEAARHDPWAASAVALIRLADHLAQLAPTRSTPPPPAAGDTYPDDELPLF